MLNFELIISSILFISIIIILLNYIEKLRIKINTLEIENLDNKNKKFEISNKEFEFEIKTLENKNKKFEIKNKELETKIKNIQFANKDIKPTNLENKIEELEEKIKDLAKLENKIRDLEDAIELKDF